MFDLESIIDMSEYGGCYRKVPFGRRTDAKAFAARLASASGGHSGTVYRCDNCGMWHVTSACKSKTAAHGR